MIKKIKGLATRILEIKIANSSVWEWLAMIVGLGSLILWGILILTIVNMREMIYEVVVTNPELGGMSVWVLMLLGGVWTSSKVQMILPKGRRSKCKS